MFESAASVEQSLSECFALVANRFPERTAIGSGTWRPTFAELNAAVHRLAALLASRGGQRGDRVAILMQHDGPLCAVILATLKLARVVVVLNSTDPPERSKLVLADSEPGLIVTDLANRSLAESIAPRTCAVVCVEPDFWNETGDQVIHETPAAPGDLAYLIYTSGSTGRPKGVMQAHRNLLHNALRLTRGMSLSAEDRVILLASPSGAQGSGTVFSTLLNGAALCPYRVAERGVTGLAEWMREHEINVYVSSASLFRNFMETLGADQVISGIRLVRLASEPSTSAEFAKFQQHFNERCVLLQTLASSELGHVARNVYQHDDRVPDGRLSVGRAVEDMEIFLQDDHGNTVASGDVGEIVVKSRFISPGYWRNETLTAQRFFDTDDGARIFHTGDLGRFNSEGFLFHAGRKDAQVKINGNRVELSEIEAVLCRCPEVAAAAVCARTTETGPQLAAYVVMHGQTETSVEPLRRALRASLPNYMVPAGFVFLEKLPLTSGGKINREALRQIEPQIATPTATESPATGTERFLAGLWIEVLRIDGISRNSNFFDLGGDSLKAAVVAARVFENRDVQLSLREFAGAATLRHLAEIIDRSNVSERTAIERAARDRPIPLSFQQEQIWNQIRRKTDVSAAAAMNSFRRIRGPLNVECLRECVSHLVERHEMLRTTFDEIAGRPVQLVQPAQPVLLPIVDFSGVTSAEERARSQFREEARKPFDVRTGPLVRFLIAKIRTDEHWLLIVSHHIVTDAWSWKLFFSELGSLYEARLRGETLPRKTERLQYADYAVWQREIFSEDSSRHRETLCWWADYVSRRPRPAHSPFAWHHWWRQLVGARVRSLPIKRLWKNRSAKSADGWLRWGIDAAATQRLEQIAREERVTFYMTRLAALVALLADECGCADVTLGVYLTRRNRIELQNLFGYFVNHAVLRLPCQMRRTFREWLGDVRVAVSEVQAHGEIPFEKLRADLRKSGVEPLRFRVYFDTTDAGGLVRFGGLEWSEQERLDEKMPVGFTFCFDSHDEQRRCLALFDPRIYHPKRVRLFTVRLARFLDAASRQPDETLAELIADRPAR